MNEHDWGDWRLKPNKRELVLVRTPGAYEALVELDGFTSARRIDDFIAQLGEAHASDRALVEADFEALRRALVDAALRDIRPDDKVVGA